MAGPSSGPIKEDLQQLRQILVPLTHMFDQLQALLAHEQEMLQQRNVEALEKLAVDIGDYLNKIRDADQMRQRMTIQLGKRLGMRAEGLNLDVLDDAMGGGTGLREMRKQLKSSIQKADETNQRTQAVFKGVLAATESILHALKTDSRGPTASYNRLGSRQGGSRFNLLSKQL